MPSTGVKTTEFWMTVLSGVILLANGTSFVDIPWDQFVIWMAANGLYIAGRTTEKVTALKTAGPPLVLDKPV